VRWASTSKPRATFARPDSYVELGPPKRGLPWSLRAKDDINSEEDQLELLLATTCRHGDVADTLLTKWTSWVSNVREKEERVCPVSQRRPAFPPLSLPHTPRALGSSHGERPWTIKPCSPWHRLPPPTLALLPLCPASQQRPYLAPQPTEAVVVSCSCPAMTSRSRQASRPVPSNALTAARRLGFHPRESLDRAAAARRLLERCLELAPGVGAATKL
jgi:hypothetical protein